MASTIVRQLAIGYRVYESRFSKGSSWASLLSLLQTRKGSYYLYLEILSTILPQSFVSKYTLGPKLEELN